MRRVALESVRAITFDLYGTLLDPAGEGSALLGRLSTINSIQAWLAPFKFVGIAWLLTGIGLALATIVQVLRRQSRRMWDWLS